MLLAVDFLFYDFHCHLFTYLNTCFPSESSSEKGVHDMQLNIALSDSLGKLLIEYVTNYDVTDIDTP